jgi:hypothetical protein
LRLPPQSKGGSKVVWTRNLGKPPAGLPPNSLVPSYEWKGSLLEVCASPYMPSTVMLTSVIMLGFCLQVDKELVMAMTMGDFNGDKVTDIVLGFQNEIRIYFGAAHAQGALAYSNSTFKVFMIIKSSCPSPSSSAKTDRRYRVDADISLQTGAFSRPQRLIQARLEVAHDAVSTPAHGCRGL